MSAKYTFVANLKMYLDFNETIEYATKNFDALVNLAEKYENDVIICPSFTSLYTLSQVFAATNVFIGAQDCCEHNRGAFTGQVSVQDLQDVGVTHCIIGHSERRKYNFESDQVVAHKLQQLLESNIFPIVCVGEAEDEFKEGLALKVLEKQLANIFELLNSSRNSFHKTTIFIAYEPTWSIGSGKIPSNLHLESVFAWLSTQTSKFSNNIRWKLLYGGSVGSENIAILKQIAQINGFLVGGTSLDFQEFKKIVE